MIHGPDVDQRNPELENVLEQIPRPKGEGAAKRRLRGTAEKTISCGTPHAGAPSLDVPPSSFGRGIRPTHFPIWKAQPEGKGWDITKLLVISWQRYFFRRVCQFNTIVKGAGARCSSCAAKLRVGGLIDFTHAACTKVAGDFVVREFGSDHDVKTGGF
jgi:hypothetical protein